MHSACATHDELSQSKVESVCLTRKYTIFPHVLITLHSACAAHGCRVRIHHKHGADGDHRCSSGSLCMYVCMYVCMHVCMIRYSLCMYVYVCMHVYMYVCMYVRMCLYDHIVYACIHVCMYDHVVYVRMYVSSHVCMYAYEFYSLCMHPCMHV